MKKWAKILEIAIKINKEQGGNFPVWGTCLGFEAIALYFSKYEIGLTEVSTKNKSRKVFWDRRNLKESAFREEVRSSVVKSMEESKLFFLFLNGKN